MRQSELRFAAMALTGLVAFSSVSFPVKASGISDLFPAAGLALEMEEGSDQESVKASTKNMAVSKKETLFNSLSKSTTSSKEKEETETEVEIPKNIEDSVKDSSKDKEEKTLIIEDAKTAKAAKSSDSDKKEEKKAESKMSDEEKSFSKLVIAKVTRYVNVRSMPSEEGEIVGKLYDKSVGEYITESNGWYKIKSGNVTGYVKGEFCVTGQAAVDLAKKVGTRVAVVNTTTLKVREEPGMDATVLGLVPIEEELSVIDEKDEWVKVDIEEGYGYVSSDYVKLRTDFVKAESIEEEKARLKKEEEAKAAAKKAAKKAEEKVAKKKQEKQQKQQSESSSQGGGAAEAVPAGDGSLGSQVVSYAKQFVGNPYVYGGSSLTNGTDCSGFVMRVYENFGVSLPHSSSADRSQGYAVDGLANAQPGDLVCYSGHVAIYAGGGKIVHASTSKTGIIVSNANYRNVLAVRRIF